MEYINVVVINGLGGVGKSEFITQCKKATDSMDDIIVHEFSTVDFVKQIAKQCGWDGGKTQRDRIFLSDLKIAMTKWNNIPITKVFAAINSAITEEPNKAHTFFVNSREPEDIATIVEKANNLGYGVLTLLVTNPNIESNEVPELVEGISRVKYDMRIENDSTIEELYKKAETFMTIMKGAEL